VSLLRRLAVQAQETRVFLLMAAFGFLVAAIYWFVSYEVAGTILLFGFGLATAVIAAKLAVDPASKRLRRQPAPTRDSADTGIASAGGAAGVDRPFADETGRLPDATIAPFAVGAGVALAATGLVFGIAPVIVGLLPLGWGAFTWLSSASDELRATEAEAAADEPAAPDTAAPAR
jgi:uncharacterized membrane protein YfcA